MPTIEEVLADKKTYPDDLKITVADGVETTLGQLRGGYLRQADYTKKTTELARQREHLEQQWQQQSAALADAERRLQELAAYIVRANPGATRDEVSEYLQHDPVASRLYREALWQRQVLQTMGQALLDLDRRLMERDREAMADQHRRVLATLKQQDPDLDEEALVRFARDNFIPRLDHAYTLFKHDEILRRERERAAEEASKKAYEKAKLELSAPPIPLSPRTASPPPETPQTLDEAAQKATHDMDVIGPLIGVAP